MSKTSFPTEEPEKAPDYKLGVFAGVFTPSFLTILGLILFLRTGYTMGNAGFTKGLLLIGTATLVSILTSASLSAVATNIHVKGGGVYYLVARTLGVQFGGAIGLVLFVAQSVSIAFYCIGFGEALSGLLPPEYNYSPQIIAMVSVLFLFCLAWLGADCATKFQYLVMVLLVFSLASFFVGGVMKWDYHTLVYNLKTPDDGMPFWALFAIFFPAVTGFTQGVNMSGDLKDPGRAIPFGTFLAVGLSTVVYFFTAVIFAGSMTNEALMADYSAMRQVSHIPWMVNAGVISATLSSAMASFLGSPRILQSIAKDSILGFLDPFAKGVGPADNPRRGVYLAGAIAMATILLGQLNLIAQVVSMFFLISYGLLNYATFFEARAASPSFRPRFKWFSPWLSLLGFILCAGAILAIDIQSGIMAVCILIAIYQYLKRTSGPARWADSRRANHLQKVKEHLKLASREPEHDRDWRPVILAFTNDSKRLKGLLEFAQWLEGGSGMTAAVRIILGEGMTIKPKQEKVYRELSSHIDKSGSHAYPLVVAVPEISQSLSAIVQSFGIGPLKANTGLINWMDELDKGLSAIGPFSYADNLRTAFREGLNLVILHSNEQRRERLMKRKPGQQVIDVWWNNDASSHLMLLLAYLMTRDAQWAGASIRILTSMEGQDGGLLDMELHKLMENIRIKADPVILFDDSVETIIQSSSKSSFVFLPMRIREHRVMDINGEPLTKLLPYLPMTALVMAARDIDLEAEPDTGFQGETAKAEDDLKEANKKYKAAKKMTIKLQQEAEALTQELFGCPTDDPYFPRLLKAADQALEDEEHAFRREAKAKVRAEEAAKAFEDILSGSLKKEE